VNNVNNEEKKEKLLQMIQEQTENSHRKAKKEYLESESDKTTEFQRTGHYVLMYMKMKELDCILWKTHLGSGNGPIGRQTAEEMSVKCCWFYEKVMMVHISHNMSQVYTSSGITFSTCHLHMA